jgi:hypothetical protein
MDCDIITSVDLADEINEMYQRLVKVNLLMGGIILITTFTNMSMLCNIKNKLKEIKNNFMPPLYKISS